MSELKYFIPDIEDIKIGYEGEQAYLHEDNWSPFKLRHPEETAAFLTGIYNRRIRVKYLTKEQIEKEGWINIKALGDRTFSKNGYIIHYDYMIKRLILQREVKDLVLRYFMGECKDINTFRYLQKLLSI